MDIKRIKQDFPIFNQQVNDEPLTYLDSAATAQMPNSVLNAIEYYYRHDHANVHRGTHTLAQRATAAYEQARQKVADFINANQTEEIVFTRSTTESLNWVAQGLTKMINPGDVIVATVTVGLLWLSLLVCTTITGRIPRSTEPLALPRLQVKISPHLTFLKSNLFIWTPLKISVREVSYSRQKLLPSLIPTGRG